MPAEHSPSLDEPALSLADRIEILVSELFIRNPDFQNIYVRRTGKRLRWSIDGGAKSVWGDVLSNCVDALRKHKNAGEIEYASWRFNP